MNTLQGHYRSMILAVLLSLLLVSVPVMAERPWIAVPSANQAAYVEITGGGLANGQTVVLRITEPDGRRYTRSELAGDNGMLNVRLFPNLNGKYSINAFDDQGRRLGGGDFLYNR